jgi:DNA-binding Xre family transcriptional regulator
MRRANYNKLFKLLIDKEMRKGELCKAANISSTLTQSMEENGDEQPVGIILCVSASPKTMKMSNFQ